MMRYDPWLDTMHRLWFGEHIKIDGVVEDKSVSTEHSGRFKVRFHTVHDDSCFECKRFREMEDSMEPEKEEA